MSEPVRDYRKRVAVVMEAVIEHVQAIAGPNARKKPDHQAMQRMIDMFPGVYNWFVDGARRLGYRLDYCQGPTLTELELKAVERLIARLAAMTPRDDIQG